MPNAWVVAPSQVTFGGCDGLWAVWVKVLSIKPAVFMGDGDTDFAVLLRVGMCRQGAGPGNVSMAGGVEAVAGFRERLLGSIVGFA
jgi:hypothetical protein